MNITFFKKVPFFIVNGLFLWKMKIFFMCFLVEIECLSRKKWREYGM